MSEALVAEELLAVGLDLRAQRDGPDLLVHHGDANIWVEIMCPEPWGIPRDWLQGPLGTTVDCPHEAILLRWTAAIKEKAEKLLGTPGRTEGYLRSGIVGETEPYIALNGPRLRGKYFATITGSANFHSRPKPFSRSGLTQSALTGRSWKRSMRGISVGHWL